MMIKVSADRKLFKTSSSYCQSLHMSRQVQFEFVGFVVEWEYSVFLKYALLTYRLISYR